MSAACILLAAKISSDLKKLEVKHLIDVRHTHTQQLQACHFLLRYLTLIIQPTIVLQEDSSVKFIFIC